MRRAGEAHGRAGLAIDEYDGEPWRSAAPTGLSKVILAGMMTRIGPGHPLRNEDGFFSLIAR